MARVPDNSLIDGVISLGEVCALLGVHATTVSRLVASGHITPVGRGQYVIRDVVSGHRRFMTESAEQRGLASHRGAVADARAILLQMKIAEEDRRLMDVDEAMDIIERVARGAVAVMTMLPGRIAPQDHDERTRITAIIDRAREELAAAFEAWAAELKGVK
jgi:Helix-turn-helix domain